MNNVPDTRPCNSPESKAKKGISLSASWKHRKNYLGEKRLSKMYNCWKAFKTTRNGKKAGWCESWALYVNFYSDMVDSYTEGLRLIRIDKSKPFSKDNCAWGTDEEAAQIKPTTIQLEYNGETKSLKEWAYFVNVPLAGLRQRYFKGKNMTVEEIIYGRKKTVGRRRGVMKDIFAHDDNSRRYKVYRMISAYRSRDKKKGQVCNITHEWFLKNIVFKPCSYCGTSKNVGCDRVDNSLGHTIDNVIPACYRCNVVRAEYYTVDEMKVIGKLLAEIEIMRESAKNNTKEDTSGCPLVAFNYDGANKIYNENKKNRADDALTLLIKKHLQAGEVGLKVVNLPNKL